MRLKYRAVIFDLDGTLVEFRFDAAAAKKAMLDELTAIDLDLSDISSKDSTQAILDKVETQICRGRTSLSAGQVMARINRILTGFEIAALNGSKPTPSAKHVLNRLHDSRVKMGLVTNSGRAATTLAFDLHELQDYFEVVLTRDEVTRLKPSGEGVKKALAALEVVGSKALFVGDSVLDVTAARDAGAVVASVAGGSHSVEALRSACPNHLIKSLEEVLDLVL